MFDDYTTVDTEARYGTIKRKEIKIKTPKQLLQRLRIGLAQVKTVNTSKHLLNEIRQTVYSLYQTRKITKIYNNVMNSM